MDDLAHILWSIAIFYRYDWWLAAFFGILPDLIVFAPFFAKKILSGKVHSVNDLSPKKNVNFFSPWVVPWYSATHSLVFIGAIIVLCSALFGYRVEYWAMLVHVLVDVPSHKRSWFGTKLFWPFSSWQFNGGDWPVREFMLANYTALALVFLIRLVGY